MITRGLGDVNNIWQEILDVVEEKMGKPTVEAFLKPSKAIINKEEKKLTLILPNEFIKTYIEQKSGKLKNIIEDILEGENLKLHLEVDESIGNLSQEEYLEGNNKIERNEQKGFLSKYTFETFVVGPGNRMAHAASLAVADNPGKAYNPLFIYGGAGLGKTHLLQAIATTIRTKKPNLYILYITSEKFTNEFINAIKDDKINSFQEHYRNIDILLVDDIQFIAGKERTQEEFFHTFNTLYESGKQIVLSSDRPPKEIKTLEERLRTRFEMGLIADIQPPDLETRIAILQKKAEIENIDIEPEALILIAEKVASNIRELEGVLTKSMALCSINQESKVTIKHAQEALKNIEDNKLNNLPTMDEIAIAVSKVMQIKLEDLKSRGRKSHQANARQIAMYLCREMTKNSLPQIGEYFGRDHSTVIHAYERIKEDISKDQTLKRIIEQIRSFLKSV
ncbi:chromosomal replication initiator protein DnaA [Thermodesulfobium acidiphilum]|uniref:Chromosomal replication initiator protein DnaA n=1 Tax=Thermodesulfobium acidiphilum TaxID=1794699 RepID=A0A2R4VXX3_THEAF|nr:chromosomal replication initiator protein DnaA [Thermodesulfobium acidiphilum]